MARGLALPTFLASLVALAGIGTSSQQLPPGYLDPQPILDAAAKAIGTDNLKCVTISGTAYGGAVGQQRESAWNVDWPRIDSLANYTRTMNWETQDNGGGVRSEARPQPRVVEIRRRLDRRSAATEPTSDLHGFTAAMPGTWTDRRRRP